jgi:hypothetical protein
MISSRNQVLYNSNNGTARKIHHGHPSLLQVIREDLSWFVFEIRQCGIQVSIHIHVPCFLLLDKSIDTMKMIVTRFTKMLGLSHRAATNTAQKNFQKMEKESQYFIKMMKDSHGIRFM